MIATATAIPTIAPLESKLPLADKDVIVPEEPGCSGVVFKFVGVVAVLLRVVVGLKSPDCQASMIMGPYIVHEELGATSWM